MVREKLLNKQSIVWAIYDCGNSAFALTVLAAIFPVFLGNYYVGPAEQDLTTARLAWTNAIASLVVFLIAPVLGTIADNGGVRKPFLAFFALLGACSTAALGLVGQGAWFWALTCFALGSIGYYGANVFYDSLLIDVTNKRNFNFVSSLGYALGYIGGAALLGVHVLMTRMPEAFGLASATVAVKVAFVTVGLWWIAFLLPILLVVREKKPDSTLRDSSIAAAYRKLGDTVREIRQYRDAVAFLIAYIMYIAGVFTVIAMGANFGQRLGFSEQDLVLALFITNIAGFPATILYGYIGHTIGARRSLYIGLVVYVGVAVWAGYLNDVRQFYAMAITIGLVQGGVQGMSRSLYASVIPQDRSGEFFGFYNMLTKFAHFVGPLIVGTVAFYFRDPKLILLPLIPLFVVGGLLLSRLPAAADATD